MIVVLLLGCVACKGKPEDVAQPGNGPIAGDETTGQPTQSQNQPQNQAEPKHGDTKVEDGQKYVYILGFGWIEDHRGEGGGGADVYDGPTELSGNKVGVM